MNTLTTSYNCVDYMCDARLSVSYEYKDNNKDSLKIKKINIKKEQSIHNYIMDADIKEIYEFNSFNKKKMF